MATAKLAENVMKENAARVKRREKPMTKAEWEKAKKAEEVKNGKR